MESEVYLLGQGVTCIDHAAPGPAAFVGFGELSVSPRSAVACAALPPAARARLVFGAAHS